MQNERGRAETGHDHIRAQCDQIGRVLAQARPIAAAPTSVDPQVTPDGPARLLQPLGERRDAGLDACMDEITDPIVARHDQAHLRPH